MDNKDCKYDIAGLTAELEVDTESIAGLFSSYFEEMKEEIASMKELLSKKDWTMLERVIHNIKGVSANLNIEDVFNETSVFDTLLKAGNSSDASSYVEKIIDLILKAETEIRGYFSQNGFSL